MAVTKGRSAISQLTATGQSSTITLASSYTSTLYIRHVNGVGTISAQGVATIEVRTQGGTNWYTVTSVGFGTTASAAVETSVALPDDASEVRLDYVAPTGSTGHTLDAEAGLVTGL